MCTFAGGHLEYLKFLKDTRVHGVSRISKVQGEMKQKPSKNISHTKNPGWSSLKR